MIDPVRPSSILVTSRSNMAHTSPFQVQRLDKLTMTVIQSTYGHQTFRGFLVDIEDIPNGHRKCANCDWTFFVAESNPLNSRRPVALPCLHVYCADCAARIANPEFGRPCPGCDRINTAWNVLMTTVNRGNEAKRQVRSPATTSQATVPDRSQRRIPIVRDTNTDVCSVACTDATHRDARGHVPIIFADAEMVEAASAIVEMSGRGENQNPKPEPHRSRVSRKV